ncbi:hypothetical protein AAFX91_36990 [Bradyrhizobium sp. 31Argb]|uniref:hypothetical protein n=1 Tax=Bradyrhizobium sp. 31Argb TaxID=3141247 RepID=UPI0037495455
MTNVLPGVLQEIAEVAGETAALSIAARQGGRRVYIPSANRLVVSVIRRPRTEG